MAFNQGIARTPVEAANFYEGVDSFSHPLFVKQTQIQWCENMVTRGGILQTRPGNKQRLAIDVVNNTAFQSWWNEAGKPALWAQGFKVFQPTGDVRYAVFAISGSVWRARISHAGALTGDVAQIQGITLFPAARQVTFTNCTQSADITGGGTKIAITAKNVLVIQDGTSNAVIWDGIGVNIANPQKQIKVDLTGNTLYPPGYNGTRIGLWCAWSGNRLWVFNGRSGWASDLGDPTHFTEELIITLVPQFLFEDNVTGAVDRGTTGNTSSVLVVSTQNNTWALRSGVQDRTQWTSTQDFQATIFKGTGCVAGKSFVNHRGILYWLAQDGIVLFDSINTTYSTQMLPPVDYEMQASKSQMGADRSLACAGYRNSYVVWSCPNGPVAPATGYPCNGHTLVLDRQTTTVRVVGSSGPFSYGTVGWQGVWTGLCPVEWDTVEINGQIRCYCLSQDRDGVPRIWETFQGNRADNGQPIPWFFISRAHPFGPASNFEFSLFRSFRLMMASIYGNVTLTGSWKGLKGAWHALLSDYKITATPGSILTPGLPGTPFIQSTPFQSYTEQSRYIKSPDLLDPDNTCTSSQVESFKVDQLDNAFMLMVQGTGRAAVVSYYLAADKHPDTTEGAVTAPETGFHILPEGGCPEFIPGTTPDYVLPDANPEDAFVPNQTRLPATPIYQSPPL